MKEELILKAYKELQEKIKSLEKKQKELKAEIAALGVNQLETENFTLKISEYTRESFQLKEALKVLDRRQLNPFINESLVQRITVNKK